MPQSLESRNQESFVKSATHADLRAINPTKIIVGEQHKPEESEVEKILQLLKNKGSLPQIFINSDNELIHGINALEAAKQHGQALILASVQRTKTTDIVEYSIIQIASIRLDGGTQSRALINQQVVDEYALIWQDGGKFPPIITFYDGTDYWLGDGFHRCLSAKQAGLAEIEADIRQGTRRDAVLYSVGANASHGLQRTNADKRRAVVTLLTDDEWKGWSDREIARRCNVNHEMVGRIRKEIYPPADGQNETRKFNRGGATHTQKAAKTPKPWIPEEGEFVSVINGEHKGKRAEVRVIMGNMALCFVGGYDKHQHINLGHMEPLPKTEDKEPASVHEEVKQQQQDLGLGKGEQVLPTIQTNEGFNPSKASDQQPANVTNLNTSGDILVNEVAIALMKLSPEQVHAAIAKAFEGWSKSHVQAAYQALHEYQGRAA